MWNVEVECALWKFRGSVADVPVVRSFINVHTRHTRTPPPARTYLNRDEEGLPPRAKRKTVGVVVRDRS